MKQKSVDNRKPKVPRRDIAAKHSADKKNLSLTGEK